MREPDQLRQPFGGKMFDDLRTDDSTERRIRQVAKVGEEIGGFRWQAFLAAECERVVVQVDAGCLDTRLAQHVKKFATAAAEIENRSVIAKSFGIDLLTLLDRGFGSAEFFGELQP